MRNFFEILILLPLLVLCYQFYSFSINSVGRRRQERCLNLGVGFMVLGVVSLVFKSVPVVFCGLILMMFGFRLVAKGLDRLDKSVFIDRFDEDQ